MSKNPPDQNVELCAWIPRWWCIFCKIHLFLDILQDFLQVSWNGDLHTDDFTLPHFERIDLTPSQTVTNCGLTWRFVPSHFFSGVSEIWASLCCLCWKLHCRAIVGGPRTLFSAACWDTKHCRSKLWFGQAAWVSYLLRRNFPHAQEVQNSQASASPLPLPLPSRFLNSSCLGAQFPDRTRQNIAEIAAGNIKKFMMFNNTKKIVSTHLS